MPCVNPFPWRLGILGWLITASLASADALDRLTAAHLKKTHEDLRALQKRLQPTTRHGPYKEFRANLHVHSRLSHDSRGEISHIVAAAKKARTDILLFSDHPAPHYDFFKQGHQGFSDGVLLIPGAETAGLLAYPNESPPLANDTREMAALVMRKGGLAFLCHLEERMNVEVPGITGVEIYNIHALFKEEKRLLAAMKNPLWLVNTAPLIREYPQEAYSALHGYPANYLARWDALCQRAPHTGVTANDAHQNIGLAIRIGEKKELVLEDALGKVLLSNAEVLRPFMKVPENAATGKEIFRIQMDGYEQALRHAATHLLMKELSRKEVWEALRQGRAFAGFDWIADSTGFDFHLESPDGRKEMGEAQKWGMETRLRGDAPLAGEWRLFRDGKKVHTEANKKLDFLLEKPGIYRAEVWLDVAGEKKVWILSNPIYLREGNTIN